MANPLNGSLTRLFSLPDDYRSNTRGMLELRLNQMKPVDHTLRGFIERCIADISDRPLGCQSTLRAPPHDDEQYIATFLERGIPHLGISIPSVTLRRFWTMLCHCHCQIMNYAKFARSFGVSDMTVRQNLEILAGTFMVRVLHPWHLNISKRLVKRPKLYFRDTGLLHALLAIRNCRHLASHHKLGASWECFAMEVAARSIGKRNEELAFWATHSGAEVDLFWREHGKNWAFEIKYADAPRLTPSMASATKDLERAHLWTAYPGDRSYPLAPGISTLPIESLTTAWPYECPRFRFDPQQSRCTEWDS